MKSIRILSVGKLKKGFWAEAANHYLKRISGFYKVDRIAVKDASSHLSVSDRILRESETLLSRTGERDLLICLDQQGKTLSSEAFARRMQSWIEDPLLTPCFLIGGAFGLSREVRDQSRFLLSLGQMTFPHEMAQVVLLEQIFRAASINQGLPYHHS